MDVFLEKFYRRSMHLWRDMPNGSESLHAAVLGSECIRAAFPMALKRAGEGKDYLTFEENGTVWSVRNVECLRIGRELARAKQDTVDAFFRGEAHYKQLIFWRVNGHPKPAKKPELRITSRSCASCGAPITVKGLHECFYCGTVSAAA